MKNICHLSEFSLSIRLSPQTLDCSCVVCSMLFWSDWDTRWPRIEKASMSGENRSLVFNVSSVPSGGWPNGLTIDYDSYRLYWIDARYVLRERTSLWGGCNDADATHIIELSGMGLSLQSRHMSFIAPQVTGNLTVQQLV